ncbi:dephospho-CoA kinase domain-containing protein-like isoform X1 [Mytilus californianus]|uniref:dephospho-CoA kinase domain-containing protein-like isoform X1 n=1 Tax=Mytilus californianus TaxID=6549 RepID=UPI002247D15F|nr:dephospho-CoA kinase domain-containing protein-like isoform X1 [Mytilus californianus]
MFLVGLTGGIATGKSTVSKILSEECGCLILDADLIAREGDKIVLPGTKAWKIIRKQFGDEVIHDNGELDREKLGQIIFADASKRRLLNSITHPEIYKSMIWKILKAFVRGRQFVILDLPLLFETGKLVPYASYIVVVSCSEEQQIERLMKRNTLSEKEADQRISSQMSLAEKRRQATYIIDNNADIEYTRQQVKNIHQKLKESYFHWKIRILISFGFLSVFGLFNYILKLF